MLHIRRQIRWSRYMHYEKYINKTKPVYTNTSILFAIYDLLRISSLLQWQFFSRTNLPLQQSKSEYNYFFATHNFHYHHNKCNTENSSGVVQDQKDNLSPRPVLRERRLNIERKWTALDFI